MLPVEVLKDHHGPSVEFRVRTTLASNIRLPPSRADNI